MIELIVTEIGMLVAFIVGFLIGNKKDNKIENPIKAIKLYKEHKKVEKAVEKHNEDLETTMANINNYDGTAAGQKKYN